MTEQFRPDGECFMYELEYINPDTIYKISASEVVEVFEYYEYTRKDPIGDLVYRMNVNEPNTLFNVSDSERIESIIPIGVQQVYNELNRQDLINNLTKEEVFDRIDDVIQYQGGRNGYPDEYTYRHLDDFKRNIAGVIRDYNYSEEANNPKFKEIISTFDKKDFSSYTLTFNIITNGGHEDVITRNFNDSKIKEAKEWIEGLGNGLENTL